MKRFGLMLGAVMALALAGAAVAAPVDVTHTIAVASATASPAEVAMGLMMAAGVLALPVAEKRAPQVGDIVDYIVPVFGHDTPAAASRRLKAEVVHVWSDSCVNLKVTSADGSETFPCSVLLVQGNMQRPAGGYATYPVQAANDSALEREIQDKGLTAPRVTPADIEASISSEHYFTAADGAGRASPTVVDVGAEGLIPAPLHTLTLCILVTQNGFTVQGQSACASPENFDAELGRKIARQDAVSKLWPLLGYELKSKLAA